MKHPQNQGKGDKEIPIETVENETSALQFTMIKTQGIHHTSLMDIAYTPYLKLINLTKGTRTTHLIRMITITMITRLGIEKGTLFHRFKIKRKGEVKIG